MKKFEYKVEVIKIGLIGLTDDSKKQENQLNSLGSQGWELILISEGKKYFKYVFKREV